MSDVSKTEELIAEVNLAREQDGGLGALYNANAIDLVDRLADALESATRVPEQGEASVAIERVRALHQPVDIEPSETICGECSFRLPNGTYFGKVEEWPCPTLAALDGAPEPETPELFSGTNAALDRLTVRKAAPVNAFCIEHGNFHAVELGDPTCEFEDGFGEPVDGEKP